MSGAQILGVAISLALVYYILGSIVSVITQLLLESQETRGKTLEEYLKKIAGEKTVDLTNLPQIKSLQPIRYKNWWGVFGSDTEPKMVEKIPVSVLVDGFFDITGLTGRPEVSGEELKNLVKGLPQSEGRDAMLKWIDQGVTNVNTLRNRAHAYFGGILDQAGAKFKANARSLVIILSIIITMALGTDTIQLARDLWVSADYRTLLVAQADTLMQQQQQQGTTTLDFDTILQELDKLSIVKFGWWQLNGALPATASALDWAGFIILKLLGLGITAAAVSQGSSFWYDILKKITSQGRSGGGGSGGDGEGKG